MTDNTGCALVILGFFALVAVASIGDVVVRLFSHGCGR